MNVTKSSLLALALAAAAAAGSAQAAEDSATFQVRLVITESCTISATAPTDIDFLSRVRSTSAVDAQGTLTVNCSEGTPYQIGLSGGANTAGDTTAPAAGERRMANGATLVPYDLFRDSGRSQFWGNTPGTDTQPGTGTAANQAYTVYARLPSTDFAAGTYADTVTARVVY